MAQAMGWVSQVTTIGLEMALPALAGHWLDQRLGTKLVFLLLGTVLGFATGMWHLLKLADANKKSTPSKPFTPDRADTPSGPESAARPRGPSESDGSVADRP
ncbi:MAG: AtpZ/AtpI family protein [Pirellulales bacterium]|nr:AtpZ/AtpI family protein [Pirellulales bacterium]